MDTDAYGRMRKKARSERDIVPPELTEAEALDAIPGQVVVRLNRESPGVASAQSDFVDSLPVFGDTSAAVAAVSNRSGISDLDSALDAIGATALFRVQGTTRSGVASASKGAADIPELADLIVVQFDKNRPTEEVTQILTDADSVAEVTPSGGFSIAVSPNDPGYTQQWGMVDVRCPEAWNLSQGDPSIVVAVVDTGCDLEHLDLAGQFAGPGTNLVSPDQSAQDDHGHGTHVAGIIAGIGNNGLDIAGVAWRTKILPVKVLNSGGRAVGTSIAQGIAWAASRSSIINCSLQGSVDDISVRAALDGARRLGVLVVAAMGNFGWGQTKPSYPAAYAITHDNVLAVGAVDRQHQRSVWGPSSSSNTGSWIGIAAPGTNIDSLRRGGGVTTMSGTSQACPHVAGAAALVRGTAPAMTAQEVLRTITVTAQPLRDAPPDPVPNPSYGFGLLDVEAALRATGQFSGADTEDTELPAVAAVASSNARLGRRILHA
jgi:thermitase